MSACELGTIKISDKVDEAKGEAPLGAERPSSQTTAQTLDKVEQKLRINKKVIGNCSYDLPSSNEPWKYKLDVIENEFPPCPKVVEKLIMKASDVKKYPYNSSEQDELIKNIMKYTGVQKDQILLTNGSDNALKLICETYMTDESNILVPVPTYPHLIKFMEVLPYKNIIQLQLNCINESVGELFKKLYDFIAEQEKQTRGIDLVYICNPNMPLGYMFSSSDLEKLFNTFQNTMFVVDEAYIEYSTRDSVLPLLIYKNLIVTRTFSKAFGLASLRLGYAVSVVENIQHMRVIHNAKNVTQLAIVAGNEVLNNIDYYMNQINETQLLKQYIQTELKKYITKDTLINGFYIMHGNFFLLRSDSPQQVTDLFAKYGVLVRNKHMDVPNYIRLTLGNKECIDYVLEAIRAINGPLINKKLILLDLDYTIREGAKSDSPLKNGVREFMQRYHPILNIVTNNSSFTPDEIQDYLLKNDIQFSADNIYTPLTSIIKLFKAGKFKYAEIVASTNIVDYLKKHVPCDNLKKDGRGDVLIILNNFYMLTLEDIIVICDKLTNGTKFWVSEQALSCPVNGCSDTPNTSNIIIPDIGSYIKIFESIGFKPSLILGKPSTFMIDDKLKDYTPCEILVIGDSTTDVNFAKTINSDIVLVNSAHQAQTTHQKQTQTTEKNIIYSLLSL